MPTSNCTNYKHHTFPSDPKKLTAYILATVGGKTGLDVVEVRSPNRFVFKCRACGHETGLETDRLDGVRRLPWNSSEVDTEERHQEED